MRKRVHIALAVMVVALVSVIAWQVLRLREPVYQGKRLSVWLVQYSTNHYSAGRDGVLDKQAENAIQQIGTEALPVLLGKLRARDTRLKQVMMAWAQKQKLVHFNFKSANQCHNEAVAGYEALGSLASVQVPSLMDTLSNDRSLEVRQAAASALGLIGPEAKQAAPALFHATTHTNQGVRNNSLWALSRILPDPKQTIPVLIAGLDDPFSVARENAAIALGKYGQAAKVAIPALLRTLSTNRAAAMALRQIDPEAAAKAGVR